MEITRDNYLISTDKTRLDYDYIYHFLSEESYWARGRPRPIIDRALDNSLCFGVYDTLKNRQIGLARVVTDAATFAWLCDVFIDAAYRGQGLGKWLVQSVIHHPDLMNIRRMILATADAHDLYSQYDFEPMTDLTRWMQRIRSDGNTQS